MKLKNSFKGDFYYQVGIYVLAIGVAASCLLTHSIPLTVTLTSALILLYWWSNRALGKQINPLVKNRKNEDAISALKTYLSGYEEGMNEAAKAIQELGEPGERAFTKLNNDDPIAQAVRVVDGKLKKFNEEERKRNWRVEGLAKFGEILRSHNIEIKELSKLVISNLVQYLGANQGGLFLLKNDKDDRYLELAACYAYNKERIREKRIEIGQGLVGQCVLEKETLYLTDIPQNYVEITSGLGEATPNNLIVVPLLINEEIHGVIEVASFNIIEKYQLRFIQQVAENIASVFASLASNEQTKKLLEGANELTTELQSREEEMRQNMEELTATQEEMSRNQAELDGVFKAINYTMGVAELDVNGNFIKANESLSMIFGYSMEEIKDRDITTVTGEIDNTQLLSTLRQGKNVGNEFKTKKRNNEEIWLNASLSPIKNNKGEIEKILVMATDITLRKQEELEFEKLSLVADNTDNSVVITDKEGLIEYVNHGFCTMTGYTAEEVMGRKPGDFLQGEDTNKETVERIKKGLSSNKPIYEEILNYTKSGESYWISMAINPVFNDDGEIDKFISIQANITQTKKNALDFRYKLDAIGKSNAIIEMDINGNILEVNDNFLEIVGFTKEELEGHHHSILVKKDFAESEDYKTFWKKLSNGEFISGEFPRVKNDGQEIWLRGMYNPTFDMNGKPNKIVKFAVDITKEKLLRKEAKEKEIDLNNHMEAINKTIASVEFDMDGNIKGANDIFISIMSVEKDALTKMHYLDIVPEEDRDKPQTKLMWDNLRDGKFFNGEFKLQSPDERRLWLAGTFNPINNAEGMPYKVMMFAQFNTAEKEKNKDLNETVAALKNTTLMMELNPDGTFKTANALFFEKFGYKRLELRQKPFVEFIKDNNFKKEMPDLMNKLADHQFIESELIFVGSDNSIKSYRTTFTPIFNLENHLSKIVVILIDREVIMKI